MEFGGKFSGYYSGYEFMLVNDLSISFAYNIFKETVNRPSVSVMLEGRRFLSESFGFGYSAFIRIIRIWILGKSNVIQNYWRTEADTELYIQFDGDKQDTNRTQQYTQRDTAI